MSNTVKVLREHLPILLKIYEESKSVYIKEVSMGHKTEVSGSILRQFGTLIKDIRNYG